MPGVNGLNDFVIAANAPAATPLAFSISPATPASELFTAPAILLNPPVTADARLPAKLPDASAFAADPSAPVTAPSAPVTAPTTAPAAPCIAAIAAAGPATTAASMGPAIALPASLPVITPAVVRADCACCKLVTTPAACAGMLLTNCVRFAAPG